MDRPSALSSRNLVGLVLPDGNHFQGRLEKRGHLLDRGRRQHEIVLLLWILFLNLLLVVQHDSHLFGTQFFLLSHVRSPFVFYSLLRVGLHSRQAEAVSCFHVGRHPGIAINNMYLLSFCFVFLD